ncbi:unnamed protein product [Periconia digitata]|uniref:DUF7492 domain-containing protein n=1 Tax=Periconia digitata TaxID=1303443 RepID=A0A9W4UKU7_9PLEO|nr:unnamed protein product [Periconia digitata]
MKFSTIPTALVALITLTPSVFAHTWIDQLRNINDKGQYVGDAGYPRGKYVQGEKGYNMDSDVAASGSLWLLPTIKEKGQPWISEETLLCHPYQREQKQTSNYPRLQTSPGTFIAMRYLENGHVTLVGQNPNDQKPTNNGTIFVYGTTEPVKEEKLVNVLQWTQDGKGGNKGGVLLAAQDYDDGRCHQHNDNPKSHLREEEHPNYAPGQEKTGPSILELPCESNVMIPKDAPTGKPYTLYWVWQWNTEPGTPGLPQGKDEYYTSCMDVDVADKFDDTAKLEHLMFQQDGMASAVPDFASRKAMYTDPIKAERGPYFSKKGIQFGDGGAAAPTNKPSGSKSTRRPGSLPTTLATVSSPAGSRPSAPPGNNNGGNNGGNNGAIDIPTMTKRPGRPLPSKAPAAAAPPNNNGGNQDNSVVTVTNVVKVTVTAPVVTATVTAQAGARVPRGARFKVAGH